MNAETKVQAEGVYAKIGAVQSELSKTGIAKTRKNQQQGYQFRGIDEVYAALAPLLAKHGLTILPRMVGRECVERTTRNGGALFNVTVEAEFDFVSADDGSAHTIRTFGEAMDSADKATNKAMSAAYKYAALMTFAIPTEGDNDADAMTHEVAPGGAAQGHSQGGADSPDGPKPRENWGGRYPTKTKLREARVVHHAELERLSLEGSLDDLEGYMTSPEYQDYIKIATERFPSWLDGEMPPEAPPEYVQTFRLEQKARDLIALRGNQSAEREPT